MTDVELQSIIDAAAKQTTSVQFVAGQSYTSSKAAAIIPPGMHELSAPLRVPKLVDVICEGQAVLRAVKPGLTALDMEAKGWRNRVEGLTFYGFDTAIRFSTGNLNTSMFVVQRCVAQQCRVFIDTVSYPASRSTILTVRDCLSLGGRIFSYCDVANIEDCWFNHHGGDDALLVLDSRANVSGCVFVPANSTAANRRWIDFLASESSRALTLTGCRFGGEYAGIPIVQSFADRNLKRAVGDWSKVGISIADCQICSAGGPAGRRAPVLLSAPPDFVSIQRCGGSLARDGLAAWLCGLDQATAIEIDSTSQKMGL